MNESWLQLSYCSYHSVNYRWFILYKHGQRVLSKVKWIRCMSKIFRCSRIWLKIPLCIVWMIIDEDVLSMMREKFSDHPLWKKSANEKVTSFVTNRTSLQPRLLTVFRSNRKCFSSINFEKMVFGIWKSGLRSNCLSQQVFVILQRRIKGKIKVTTPTKNFIHRH